MTRSIMGASAPDRRREADHDRNARRAVRLAPGHARPARRRGCAAGLRAGLPDACARQRRALQPAELQARRGGRLPQPLARQVGLPEGHPRHRRPALQLLRRRRAQHGRRAGLHALHRAVGSPQRRAAGHCRRALELRHPQHGGCDHCLQMGRSEKSKNARARGHRNDGRELLALPLRHVPIRGNPLHVAPARDAPGLRGEMVAGTWNSGRAGGVR